MVSSMLMGNLQNTQAAQTTAENSWQTMQSLLEPLSGIAVTAGDKIYIFSGSNYTTHLFVYDTQSQTLTQTSSMPTYRIMFGVAVVDHKIYTIGGQHYYRIPGDPAVYGHPANVTEVYDTQTGTWETKQPAFDADFTIANAVKGKIYAMTYSHMDVYDPETDTWTRKQCCLRKCQAPATHASSMTKYT